MAGMLQAQVHRGPDDQGEAFLPWRSPGGPGIRLGFRRLAIRDLSPRGRQPMAHPVTGDVLVFNGEIYNTDELRDRLSRAGSVFQGTSDTEVLLHGLVAEGAAFLDRVDGMYGFAFVRRDGSEVLLARDHAGIKPLYVAQHNGLIIIASELRAVLASGLVKTDFDRAAIAGLLAFGAVQEPATMFASVRMLPAGCTQRISLSGGTPVLSTPARFWSFPRPAPARRPHEARASLRDTLTRCVREQLVADVPVGVFLSGGIDSTIIATLASRAASDVRTFTVGFDDHPDLSESAIAAQTARSLNVRHTDIQIGPDAASAQVVSWLASLDQPTVDGLNSFIVSRAVRDAGAVVALSGLGGDELFGGYPSFRDVRNALKICRAISWVPAGLRASLFRAAAMRRPIEGQHKAASAGRIGPDLLRQYLMRRRLMTDAKLRKLGIPPQELGLDHSAQSHEVLSEAHAALSGDEVADISGLEYRFYMGNMLLRDTDVMSMAHSLEIRVPFLARPVVELAASLPGGIRMPAGSAPKHLLREVFSDCLGPNQLHLPKRGFTLPIRRWMLGPLLPLCEDGLSSLCASGLLDARGVNSTWQRFLAMPETPVWSSAFMLVVLGNYLAAVRSLPKTAKHRPANLDTAPQTPADSARAAA